MAGPITMPGGVGSLLIQPIEPEFSNVQPFSIDMVPRVTIMSDGLHAVFLTKWMTYIIQHLVWAATGHDGEGHKDHNFHD